MLKRLLSATVLATLLASGALAQGVTERQVIDQLRDQGFSEFRVSRTLLGRTMIVATNREYRREIVINPGTGVILRDYWRALGPEDGDDDDTRLFSPRSGNSGSGNSGRDDDDDDGGRSGSNSGSSNDDDDDNGSSSGSGGSGSNSGSGSSGSGGGDDNDDD